MPFSTLTADDKVAFFSLLDEYFQSRPQLLNNAQSVHTSAIGAGVIQRTVGNSAAAALGQGLHDKFSKVTSSPSTAPNHMSSVSGPAQTGNASAYRPPVPPSRAPVVARPPTGEKPAGLLSAKKLGDLDISSPGAMWKSIQNKPAKPASLSHPVNPVSSRMPTSNTTTQAPGTSSQSTLSRSSSGSIPTTGLSSSVLPPPTRRLVAPALSNDSQTSTPPTSVITGSLAGRTTTEDQTCALALYDFEPTDAEDLGFKEGQRLIITDQTSNDWWKGKLEGTSRIGSFPAAYVELTSKP